MDIRKHVKSLIVKNPHSLFLNKVSNLFSKGSPLQSTCESHYKYNILLYLYSFYMVTLFCQYHLTYFPTRAKESTINIINIPKNEYNITSSVTLFVLSSCCCSNKVII